MTWYYPPPSDLAWSLCIAMLVRVPRSTMANDVLPHQGTWLAKAYTAMGYEH